MAKEIKCPGKKLEFFLLFLDPVMSDMLLQEPDGEEIMERIKEFNPDISELELDRIYRTHFLNYHKSHQVFSELQELGRTSTQIHKSLRSHVNICWDCAGNYLDTLIGKTISFKSFHDKMGEKLQWHKRFYPEFFTALKEEDSKYLKLL